MSNSGDIYQQKDPEIISSLIESLPLYVFAKDRQGRFIHANSFYCQKIGLPLEKLVGLDDFAIHPPDLAEKYRQDDNRIMTLGRIESIEESWQSITSGTESQWIQVIKAPLKSHETGETIGTIGVFWDITEKKQSEIALAEERNLLRTLIDNLPDYIYVKDLDSSFLLANEAVANLMGAGSPDNLLGRTDHDFYPAEQADGFRDDERQVIESGEPVFNKEEEASDLNGEKRLLRTTKVPLKNIQGEISGIIGIGHDITHLREVELEQRRLEQQLHHAQKMETIGTLTSGIAHDFNNLLSVINGYAELLQLSTPPGTPHHENIGRVLKAGRTAARLVGQLLAFSRKQAAQARVINLNGELERMGPMLIQTLGEPIVLRMKLESELWPIRMDPSQLEQIVVNLATNAKDAMPDGGELILTTRNVVVGEHSARGCKNLGKGDWVMLSVRDTGDGISPEARDHLFEPFFTTKPKDKGTGLGLATVFGIVKQNKGHIVAGNCEGEHGAEFVIYFNRCNEPLSVEKTSDGIASIEECRGTETIMVVEDDSEVRNLVHTILVEHGYTVIAAENGAEALLGLEGKGKEVHLILTDVIMPGINGKMLADEVERRRLGIKVLFMSGYTNDAISKYGIIDDGIQFLHKPFRPADLLLKVRSILDS